MPANILDAVISRVYGSIDLTAGPTEKAWSTYRPMIYASGQFSSLSQEKRTYGSRILT